jgi:uncharacterized repeat protein (TIGR03803 family)
MEFMETNAASPAATCLSLGLQAFTTLASFNGGDGAYSTAGLVQATDGNLYGTTAGDGEYCYPGCAGTVLKVTPSGTLTTIYNFCPEIFGCADGEAPNAGLVQATDGDLYGTTYGGNGSLGTVFKITRSGTLTTLYSFCSEIGCTDGEHPIAGLVQAPNGDFYGTTAFGGANAWGTVFRITPSGTLTTLYNFCSQGGCADGELPEAGLVQATNGDFYGTNFEGGANGGGTVFRITPDGMLTTLYSFCAKSGCADGSNPSARLVETTNGDLYGTTAYGGATCAGAGGCGTVFKITPSGTLTTLYSFCSQGGCMDGASPFGPLTQGTDGAFFGTTNAGGAHACASYGVGGCGTIFEITPSGTLTTLYSFCAQGGCADGEAPAAELALATNGAFYGTTVGGGTSDSCDPSEPVPGCGTVFALSVGLGPFVETLPTSASAGAAVKILGTNLTGATSVSFNGEAAVFTVVSPSLITTTVPAGATTGEVQVVTPGGTLSSDVVFHVP